ncbi:hypothetical protein MCEORH2_01177 [Methylophilaceae bacterium]
MKIIHYPVLAMLALGALAPSLAQAQSGSRLCGHVAIETPTKIGLLFEARDDDATYHEVCAQAINDTMDKINGNAQLKSMKWKKIERFKCEEVGNMGFVNAGQSPDICDNMQAKVGYKVMKQGKANATYEKQ